MSAFDQTIINEVLLFLKGWGGKSPRYNFDQFITVNIIVENSFNVVPLQLLEDGLIKIIKEESDTFIELTEKGDNCINNFYSDVSSVYDYIVKKFYLIKNLSVSKNLPFINLNDENFHLKIKCQSDGDQIFYFLKCIYKPQNHVISEIKISNLKEKGLDLLVNLIEFYFSPNKLYCK